MFALRTVLPRRFASASVPDEYPDLHSFKCTEVYGTMFSLWPIQPMAEAVHWCSQGLWGQLHFPKDGEKKLKGQIRDHHWHTNLVHFGDDTNKMPRAMRGRSIPVTLITSPKAWILVTPLSEHRTRYTRVWATDECSLQYTTHDTNRLHYT